MSRACAKARGFLWFFGVLSTLLCWSIVPLRAQTVIGSATEVVDSKGSDKGETALGNLVADAIRTSMSADVAVVHSGALIGVLPKGEITDADVESVIPLGDDVVMLLMMKGRDIKALLERSVGLFPKTNKGFLQVSGIEFEFDASAPKGNRIVSWTIGGSAPDPDAEYGVAVPGFLAGGGMGYKEFGAGKLIEDENPLPLIQAVINYIKRSETLKPQVGGRIIAKKSKNQG